jgi:hypothetical protein
MSIDPEDYIDRSHEDPAAMAALDHVAYDPTRTHLDLNKDEKLRTTALMLAIKQYTDFICKDADMFNAIMMRNGSMKPATVSGVIRMAIEMEKFIRGRFPEQSEPALLPSGEEDSETAHDSETPDAA